jgi:hypothetical protein
MSSTGSPVRPGRPPHTPRPHPAARAVAGRRRIEPAVSTAGQPRNLTEGAFSHTIAAFLEHEHLHAQQPQLTGQLAKAVHILLHAVAHIDHRIHLARLSFLADVFENLENLSVATTAIDGRHQPRQRISVGHPLR